MLVCSINLVAGDFNTSALGNPKMNSRGHLSKVKGNSKGTNNNSKGTNKHLTRVFIGSCLCKENVIRVV